MLSKTEDKKGVILENQLNEALQSSDQPENDKDVASVYLLLADHLLEIKDYTGAQSAYDQAAQIFKNLDSKDILTRIDLKLGTIENELGQFEKAGEIFESLRGGRNQG